MVRKGGTRAAMVLAGAICLLLVLGAPAMAASTVVGTQFGELQGQVTGSVRSFLGVPFAAPPVGDLRWRSPQPPASWSGVRDATQPGPICAQGPSPESGEGSTSEDCLYLNVYTPASGTKNLPVMVWIHGGGWLIGAGSHYDPSELVARGNVIVVTINYRLGALGYLALPGFADENRFHSTGNYGFQDQQQALRWVHANIAGFGGDPDNVTIAGESAGGFSVCDHLAAPDSQGLFEKAIVQSGPCSSAIAAIAGVDMRTRSVRFAARPALGCTGTATAVVACMRAKPVEELQSALLPSEATDTSIATNLAFFANVDGHYLPTRPRAAILAGRADHVPVLIGTTRNEGNLVGVLNNDMAGRPLNADTYTSEVGRLLEPSLGAGAGLTATVITGLLYPLGNYPAPGYDPFVAPAHLGLGALITDLGFSCSTQNTSGFTTVAGQPTYQYEFSDPNAPFPLGTPSAPLGAYHGSEVQYMLGRSPLGGDAFAGMTPAQVALAQRMMDYWTNFAKTGNPNGSGLPVWPGYGSSRGQIMSLAPGNAIGPISGATFAREHKCALWGPADITTPALMTLLDILPKPAATDTTASSPSPSPSPSPAAVPSSSPSPAATPSQQAPISPPGDSAVSAPAGNAAGPVVSLTAPPSSCRSLLQSVLKLFGLGPCPR
jgi:para-nitrobenzyl esterase